MRFEVGDIVRIAKDNPETCPDILRIRDNGIEGRITSFFDGVIHWAVDCAELSEFLKSEEHELKLVRRSA